MVKQIWWIDDADEIAREIANGAIVAQAFANFYGIVTLAEPTMVRKVNELKGRPPNQVGSIVTIRPYFEDMFDWSKLPSGLTRELVLDLMDATYARGPLGFRGPAAPHVPDVVALEDEGVRTTQIIGPGYACPCNQFLKRALEAAGDTKLYITSANRSHHLTGAKEEPAHYRADDLEEEFGHAPGFVVVRHRDEAAARARYPLYAPTSTTVVSFHKMGPPDEMGRPSLYVERHGSLHVEHLRQIADEFGLGLTLALAAMERLPERRYAANAA